MSDDKPFAEIKPETSIPDAEGFSVVVEGEELCPPWGNWAESGANDYAAKINAAVTARERKAAVEALREAAKAYDSEPQTMTHYDCIAEALRARAESIEKGTP